MNRQERRKFKKNFASFSKSHPKEAAAIVSAAMKKLAFGVDKQELNPGDKVKLNMAAIKADPDYNRLVPKRRLFVESNSDTIFTVEYDPRHTNNPSIVCLAEDETDPKWLWYTGHLMKVETEENGDSKQQDS